MLCALALAVPMLAQAVQEALVIALADGTEEVYFLSDTPVISYSSTQMHIDAPSMSGVHEMADIREARFENRDPSGLQALHEGDFAFRYDRKRVALAGLREGEEVSLYSLSGVKALTLRADSDGRCEIDVTSLPEKAYIVKSSKKTLKISR